MRGPLVGRGRTGIGGNADAIAQAIEGGEGLRDRRRPRRGKAV